MLQAFWLFICEDFTDADQPCGIFSAVTQLYFHLTQPSQEKIEYQTSNILFVSLQCLRMQNHIRATDLIGFSGDSYQIDNFIFYSCKAVFCIQQDSREHHIQSLCAGRERDTAP